MKVFRFTKAFNAGKYVAMAALLVGTMAACSNDNDDEGGPSSFDTPKYEAEAAKYVIDDQTAAPYKSIELTASGNFIIMPSDYVNYVNRHAPATSKSKLWHNRLKNGMITANAPMPITRVYSLIVYGSYTKTGENQYNLEGFGTLTIIKDADGTAHTIVLTPTGKPSKEYTAHKQNADINGETSSKLCRTWSFESFRIYSKVNGKTVMDITASTLAELAEKVYEWAKKNDPEFEEDEWEWDVTIEANPENVIFTKTGTYVVLYSNEQLAVSTWKWADEKNGILRYSWNPDSFNDAYLGGDVKIEFKNNRCYMTEGDFEYDKEDNEYYEEGITYIMTEAK